MKIPNKEATNCYLFDKPLINTLININVYFKSKTILRRINENVELQQDKGEYIVHSK